MSIIASLTERAQILDALLVDAYGEPGEDYPISMENRPDRMERITVRDVLDRVERWRTRYAGASASSAPNV